MDLVQEFLSSELGYVVLLFALFVVPRMLQAWGIPAAITSFAMGVVAGGGFGLYKDEGSLRLLATFGIVSLFLFAGLDVSLSDLRRGRKVIALHLAVMLAMFAAVAWASVTFLDVGWRPATLVALALLTPSTGFILDSLHKHGLSSGETFWVKSKTIAAEILALLVLFATLQSATALRLAGATLSLMVMVVMLPLVFRIFARALAPYAPKSEFAFLLMLALLCAYATRQLGAYYLVGAFIVGIAARRFKDKLPTIASENMLHSVDVFASFFIPFYFFSAGVDIRREDISAHSILLGAGFLVVLAPLRTGEIALLRRFSLGESLRKSVRVAIPMMPTLVFSLVLAKILREEFAIAPFLYGGIVIYALLSTLLPSVCGLPPPSFEGLDAEEEKSQSPLP